MVQHGPVGDFPVKDKIVVVTGGGSGIGFAFVQQCHQNGARVMIGDLKLTAEAESYCSKQSSSEIVFQKCDVTSWQDLHDLISASVKHFGTVPDVYCPCAGIFEPPFSNFWDDSEGDSYKTLRINVDHPIKFTRLAIRALAGAEKQGVVCLISSAAGLQANYLASLYSSSKFAIVGFTKAMGQADIDEGVRVVCVCPGMVTTSLWTDRQDKMFEWTKYGERQACLPEEIAETMVRMVQKGQEFQGGCIVLKLKSEERVIDKGHSALIGQQMKDDPNQQPGFDLGRVRQAIDGERGKKWM